MGNFYSRFLLIAGFLALLLPKVSAAQCDFSASVTKGCSPLVVKFKVLNVAPGTQVTWDFGQGSQLGIDSASKVFTAAGKYDITISLTVNGSPCTLTKKALIEVLPKPVPNITVIPGQVICNGAKPTSFIDKTPGAVSWNWVIDGKSYTGSQVDINFTNSGYKSLALEVKNSSGCVEYFSDNKFVQVYDSIPMDFCADMTISKTSGISAKFTENCTPGLRNITSYEWSFPGGSPSTYLGKNPGTVTYPNLNSQDVTLKITTQEGCVYTCTRKSFIMNYLKATKDTLCVGKVMGISNMGNNLGRGLFEWNLPNAQTDPPPSAGGATVSYFNAGQSDYGIAFRYGQNGCKSNVVYPKAVNVLGPKAAFSSVDRVTCRLTDTVHLKNDSKAMGAANVLYTWYITDSTGKVIKKVGPTSSTAGIEQTFSYAGKFNVALKATSSNGCVDSVYVKEFIMVNPLIPDFTTEKTTVCLGTIIQLVSKVTPAEGANVTYKYTWNLQHADSTPLFYTLTGKTPNFQPVFPGRYHVKMTVKSNDRCTDTITKLNYLTVNGAMVDFTVDTSTGCPDPTFEAHFSMKPKIKKWPNTPSNKLTTKWLVDPVDDVFISNPNDPNTTIYFKNTGCYDIIMNVYDAVGCTTEVRKEKMVCIGTPSFFQMGQVKCLGDSVGTTSYSDKNATYYRWTIEPKNAAVIYPSDTIRQPGFIFNKDTCYTIKLTTGKLIRGRMCYATYEKVQCMDLPHAQFSSKDTLMYCAPQVATFSAEMQTARQYFWDFGDGFTLKTDNPNPSHIYTQNSNDGFNVMMVAIDSNGCNDTVRRKNYIRIIGPEPKFKLSAKGGCDSAVVKFTDLSKRVSKFYIFYDDGTLDSNFMGTRVYRLDDPTKDSLFVYPTIMAKDANCSNNYYYKDTIKIYKSPRANFSADSTLGCIPLKSTFKDLSINAVWWKWDFDNDGKVDDTTKNPVFTYTKPGKYTVRLITGNRLNCTDSSIKTSYIEALPLPIASFTSNGNRFCQKATVNFKNTSRDYESLTMDYGDGTAPVANLVQPHTYSFDPNVAPSDSQVFYVSLRAYNKAGCESYQRDTIVVYARPVTGFSADVRTGCPPLTVNFTDTSMYATSWEWDMDGDGKTDRTGQFVNWNFPPGKHSIRLITKGRTGCADTVIRKDYIEVNPQLIPRFDVSTKIVCVGEKMKFIDQSGPKGAVQRWRWKFDDPNLPGDTSLDQNPEFTFLTAGWKNISLTVYDSNNCATTLVSRAVFVEDTLPPVNTDIRYVTVTADKKVKVVWRTNTVYDFKSYNLRRDGMDAVPGTAAAKDTVTTDTAAVLSVDHSAYCYQLQTRDLCDNLSAWSPSHCTVLLEVTTGVPEFSLLKWSAYKGWTPAGYNVYRSNGGDNYLLIGKVDGGTLTYTDSNLCDENYCYMVEAVHPNGEYLSQSNRVCVHPPYTQQGIPGMTVATVVNDKEVLVKWEQATQPRTLTTYLVDRWTPAGGWQKGYALTAATSLVDKKVDVFNEQYMYRVRVQDRCGYVTRPTLNASPILLRHQIENDQIKLYWTRYRQWDKGVNRYVVQVRKRNGSFRTIKELSGLDSTYLDQDVYPDIDTAYCYRVLAIEDDASLDTSVSNTTCAILPSRVYVPNAFTPGGSDTLNSVWKVSSLHIYNLVGSPLLDFRVRVFNRWGMLMWEANDVNAGWDGNYNGKQAPMDAYLYQIVAHGIDGRSLHVKGTVTLIR